MKNTDTKIFLILSILTLFAVNPFSVRAFSLDEFFEGLQDYFLKEDEFSSGNTESQVVNKVNVSVNTGNKSADEGEVNTGEGRAIVQIENIIQGKSVDPIAIDSEANEVKVKSEIEANEGTAQVHREIQIDSETSAEDYEIDLENPDSDISDADDTEMKEEGNLEKLFDWGENFFDSLKSFFENIFSIF